VIDCVD